MAMPNEQFITNFQRKVREYLKKEEQKIASSNTDINLLERKQWIKTILSDRTLFINATRVEYVNMVCSCCEYLKNNLNLIIENEKYYNHIDEYKFDPVFPNNILDQSIVSWDDIYECNWDSELLRKKLLSKYGLIYYSYDELVEAKENSIKNLEYQSGVILDDNNNISYRLLEHPYLLDKEYILNNDYVPKRLVKDKIKRR